MLFDCLSHMYAGKTSSTTATRNFAISLFPYASYLRRLTTKSWPLSLAPYDLFLIPFKILTHASFQLHSGSRNARSDDTKNVREAIVLWLTIAFSELSPALDPHSRDNRGIYHDDLGRLLCPVKFDWDDGV